MAILPAPAAPRRSRRAPLAALALVLLALVSLLPLAVFAPPADAAPRLDVVLSGRFDGPEHTGVIAATVSPKAFSSATTTPPPTLPVILTAGCTDASPCRSGEGTLVTWDFGDGDRVTTDKLAVAHPYREPGVYTVRVQVSTAAGVGEDEVQVLVSPRYADADADLADKPGRADREAIWAASALGLLGPCRPAFPSIDGVDPSSTDVNRGVFCPEPSTSYGPSGVAPAMPAGATANGLTGISCLTSWSACGLPVEAFSAATGNPQASCGSACSAALRSEGFLDSANRLVYTSTNCLDGWAAVRSSGTWTVTPGTEPGCVSRADFYAALVIALDGDDSASRMLAPETTCVDVASTPGAVQMRRAAALGLPVTHSRGGQAYCDGAMAVTKSEVYHALAVASGLPQSAPTGLRDLVDGTLGRGAAAPHPAAGSLGALLSQGAVLVGSTSCSDGVGTCFVPGEAVTRSQLSSLMAGLFVGMPSLASGLQVGISPSANPMAVGSTIELRLNVRVPASHSAAAPVTVSWPPVSAGVSTRGCPDTQQVVPGEDRLAELTCSYTRSVPGTTALAVSVTDAAGNTATASVPLIATNDSPLLTAVDVPAFDEDTTAQVVIPASDPEDTPLSFSVRSVLPAQSAPGTFPLTGRSPSLSWGAEAEVAIGKVRVVSTQDDAATVLVTPDRDVYGPYSFAVEVCDNSTCSTQTVTGVVRPVNDAPRARLVVGATGARSDVLSVRLSGSDPSDSGREGYSGVGIDLFRIESLPQTGVLRYDADPGTGTQYVAATAGATTNNPVLRYEPASGSRSGEAAEFFTFSVRDTGHPSSLWSTSRGFGVLIVKG